MFPSIKKGHLQGPTPTPDAAVSDLYNFLWPQNWPSSLNCKNSVSVILSTPVLICWPQWPSGSCDVDSLCSLTFLNTNKVAHLHTTLSLTLFMSPPHSETWFHVFLLILNNAELKTSNYSSVSLTLILIFVDYIQNSAGCCWTAENDRIIF